MAICCWDRDLNLCFIEKGYLLSMCHDDHDRDLQEVIFIFYKPSHCMLIPVHLSCIKCSWTTKDVREASVSAGSF